MLGRILVGALALLACTAPAASAADDLAITSTPRVDAPRGFFGNQPLRFSYTVANQTKTPVTVAQFAARVTGPGGDHLDVPCANGANVTLAAQQTFTCDAPRRTPATTCSASSPLGGLQDVDDWHELKSDGVQHFTLTQTPQTSVGGTGGWNLGNQLLGGSSDTPVTLTNTGDAVLLIDHLSVDPGDFAVAGETCTQATIAPGASCAVTVRFTPSALGARAATLSFQANTTPATNSVSLVAAGTAAPLIAPLTQTAPPIVNAAPPAKLAVTLRYEFLAGKRSTRFTSLVLKGVPAGATVRVSCSKKACAAKSYSVKKAGSVSLKSAVRKALKPGAKVTVKVSKPGAVTVTKTLTVRAGKRPTLKG